MLTYAAACRDLEPVKGRENIVLQAVRITKEGSCLIDAYMSHNMAGEWNKIFLHISMVPSFSYLSIVRTVMGPLIGIKGRIQKLRNKVENVRKEFITAIVVDIRNEGACPIVLNVRVSLF